MPDRRAVACITRFGVRRDLPRSRQSPPSPTHGTRRTAQSLRARTPRRDVARGWTMRAVRTSQQTRAFSHHPRRRSRAPFRTSVAVRERHRERPAMMPTSQRASHVTHSGRGVANRGLLQHMPALVVRPSILMAYTPGLALGLRLGRPNRSRRAFVGGAALGHAARHIKRSDT